MFIYSYFLFINFLVIASHCRASYGHNFFYLCMDRFVNWMRVCCIIVYTLHKQILGLPWDKRIGNIPLQLFEI